MNVEKSPALEKNGPNEEFGLYVIPDNQNVGIMARPQHQHITDFEDSFDEQLTRQQQFHNETEHDIPSNQKKQNSKNGQGKDDEEIIKTPSLWETNVGFVSMDDVIRGQQTATYSRTIKRNKTKSRKRKRKRTKKHKKTRDRTTSSQNTESSKEKNVNSNTEEISSTTEITYSETSGSKPSRKKRSFGSDSGTSGHSISSCSEMCGNDSEKTQTSESSQTREKIYAKKLIEEEKKRVFELIEAQENCFACMWARKDYDKVEQSDINLMEQFFCERYSKMNRKAFCAVMEKMYIQNIKKPYAKRGLKLPDWSKEMIEEHILYHDMDPDVVFTEVISVFFTTFMEMQNSFFYEKKINTRIVNPNEIDPETGKPVVCEYSVTKWEPNTRNIRCGIEVAKALREFFKLSNSEFAPERKRTKTKNLSPTFVSANRINFSSK